MVRLVLDVDEDVYYAARATASAMLRRRPSMREDPARAEMAAGEGGEERERQKRAQEREADGRGRPS